MRASHIDLAASFAGLPGAAETSTSIHRASSNRRALPADAIKSASRRGVAIEASTSQRLPDRTDAASRAGLDTWRSDTAHWLADCGGESSARARRPRSSARQAQRVFVEIVNRGSRQVPAIPVNTLAWRSLRLIPRRRRFARLAGGDAGRDTTRQRRRYCVLRHGVARQKSWRNATLARVRQCSLFSWGSIVDRPRIALSAPSSAISNHVTRFSPDAVAIDRLERWPQRGAATGGRNACEPGKAVGQLTRPKCKPTGAVQIELASLTPDFFSSLGRRSFIAAGGHLVISTH